ncbi:MAG: hypothetical protein M1824_005947 [Vezdaea acicularis]|nr:MAG: hypothetical protein M1824_005947 [Vezdaea acicularis]
MELRPQKGNTLPLLTCTYGDVPGFESDSAGTRLLQPGDVFLFLKVGLEETLFRYSKLLLCSWSPYFVAVTQNRWEGLSEDDPIYLPDVDTATFSILTHWLAKRVKIGQLKRDFEWEELARLFVIADRFDITQLRNEIIDEWVWKAGHQKFISKAALDHIVENTLERSNFRRLVVDMYVWTFGSKPTGRDILEYSENFDVPPAILKAIEAANCKRVDLDKEDARPPWEINTCYHYHDHNVQSPPLDSCVPKRTNVWRYPKKAKKRKVVAQEEAAVPAPPAVAQSARGVILAIPGLNLVTRTGPTLTILQRQALHSPRSAAILRDSD